MIEYDPWPDLTPCSVIDFSGPCPKTAIWSVNSEPSCDDHVIDLLDRDIVNKVVAFGDE